MPSRGGGLALHHIPPAARHRLQAAKPTKSHQRYGQTTGASAVSFNVAGGPIYKIEQSTSGGNLRGLRFTNSRLP